ncbi:MAG: UDP-N-acetylmuramate--L-alanine ligase [Propionibacteriaceae bacterium]|nr:UDP-N-acetylmuramate--L-alanine ligase [Propionibacteriaceae bacterium]
MTVDLAQPVEPLDRLGPVHFIAIGGAGMSGIARLYLDRGLTVSGSDQSDSDELRALAAAGARVWVGHEAARLGPVETAVVSSAIRSDNVEYEALRDRGVRLWHRSTALAALMLGRTGVAVAGTHGKTTTTGMIVTALTGLGRDPGYVIGSTLATSGQAAALGTGPEFVVEADESDGSFVNYPAQLAVITNIDQAGDHLDHWRTAEAYQAGFAEFARGPQVEQVVISADDPGAAGLLADLRAEGRSVTSFGFSPTADVRLTEPVLNGLHPTAQLQLPGAAASWPLRLSVPGKHNLLNAAAAVAAGLALGAEPSDLVSTLADFRGTARRFEFKGEIDGITVVDDYAHHPTEIAATVAAARTVADGRRLVAAFQPHLFSRTRDLADQLGASLAAVDALVVTDIYPAREAPLPGVTGQLVAQAADRHGLSAIYQPQLSEVAATLRQLVQPGDLVLTLGAGSITTVGPALLMALGAA